MKKEEIKIFENQEFGEIRTVMIDGEPWFVGRDAAGALRYNEPHKAVVKHVDEKDRIKHPILTSRGEQMTWVVNESGLYALIMGSKLPSAKRFQHWVTAEVLPAIRMTGAYGNAARQVALTEHPGEVANLLKSLTSVAKDEGLPPYKIAENTKLICEQYGIQIISDFVKVPEHNQMGLSEYFSTE